MSERGFFSASNDIKTLDGNIFSGFPWLTTHLLLLLLLLPSIYIAPHEERSALQKKRMKNREQKLWKQVSFQLPLEHRQGLRFT